MPLPPLPEFLRPKAPDRSPAGAGDEGQAIQAVRTRARQRLVGSLVLLVVGVVSFPLLFETQPRPLAVDTPIKLSQRDAGTVVNELPAPRPAPAQATVLPEDAGVEALAASAVQSGVPPVPAAASAPVVVAPTVLVTTSPPAAASRPAVASGPLPARAPAPSPVQTPAPASTSTPSTTATQAPAQAAAKPPPLAASPEPKAAAAASSPATGRFVVQVGAFSDARLLREARQKVEGLGLKSYTQVIDSSAGQRTRVRVGPFDTRAEAEAAARTIKGGGLPAAILSL